MDNATYVANCNAAQEIAADNGLINFLIIRLAIFVLGLLMLVGMFYMEGRFLAYHPNARILLMANNVWIFLQSLAYIVLLSFDIHRFTQSHANSCDYLVSAAVSVLVRAPPDIAMYGQCWSMFFLALERSVATVCYRQYEKTTNTTIGWLMLVTQIILPCLWIVLLVFDFDWDAMKVSCSLVNGRTQSRFLILMSSMAVLEVFTVLWLFVLYAINNFRLKLMNTDQSRHKLTEKYQICENMRAIAHVFPIIVTHFVFFCATLVAQPINTILHANQGTTVSTKEFHVSIETFNFLPFYAFALPVVLFVRNRSEAIDAAWKALLVKVRIRRPPAAEVTEGQIYFQQLGQMFDNAAHRIASTRNPTTNSPILNGPRSQQSIVFEMSPIRLSLALFAFLVASALAHSDYGYGSGYGSDYGARHGYGEDGAYHGHYGKGEKSDWEKYNYGGHASHADGDHYGSKYGSGYGSQYGHDGDYAHGYGAGYGAPHYGY